ncbi:hypothetical protein P3T37_003607 [Kitasatospora sp. MAA4]|uniref:hypothetical protein n=1 Tax=Kitasatospora sp. MAA4 TaxID=3035093 RepID=UPI0024734CCC|nr:hypothetical protein [Kitasatospora sp. MAA4]MDH6134205.1 hypothetical protein [Kitasatospora sp. MAA4]
MQLAPSTLRVHYSYVTAIFRLAELDRRKEIVPLAVTVVAALLDGTPGWYRSLLLLAAASGLWQGELFGLEVEHIDFPGTSV